MVSGCVGFFRNVALTLGPSLLGTACAKFQVSFKWSRVGRYSLGPRFRRTPQIE